LNNYTYQCRLQFVGFQEPLMTVVVDSKLPLRKSLMEDSFELLYGKY
jgi:hypothetical protein